MLSWDGGRRPIRPPSGAAERGPPTHEDSFVEPITPVQWL
jgi:hypothetical protein